MSEIINRLKQEAMKKGLMLHAEPSGPKGIGLEFQHNPRVSNEIRGHLEAIIEQMQSEFPTHAFEIEQQTVARGSHGPNRRVGLIFSRLWVRKKKTN